MNIQLWWYKRKFGCRNIEEAREYCRMLLEMAQDCPLFPLPKQFFVFSKWIIKERRE